MGDDEIADWEPTIDAPAVSNKQDDEEKGSGKLEWNVTVSNLLKPKKKLAPFFKDYTEDALYTDA